MNCIKKYYYRILLFSLFFSITSVGVAQITFNAKDQKILQILHIIEKNSNYSFFYNNDLKGLDKIITISPKNQDIETILKKIFSETEIGYQIDSNKQVVLFDSNIKNKGEFIVPQGSGQSKTQKLTGTVTDVKTSEPLFGVNIVISGTTNGVITDLNGYFSIEAPIGSLLECSFIGYISKKVKVDDQTHLVIALAPEVMNIEEIAVIGYGTMRKKDLTGSIMQIKPEKIADENPKTVQDILRGMPGLNVGFNGSAKGGGSMQIRGQRSIYTDGNHNDPLIILDGMMFYGELSEISPDDISQIDILKDASASAVYGAKAANGVIIITTKKGKTGKPVINLTSSIGFSTMGVNQKVYDPEGYMKYREDYYTSDTYGVNAQTGEYGAYQATSGTAANKPGYFSKPSDLEKYGISLEQWRAYTSNSAGITDNEIYARRLGLASSDVTLSNYLAGKSFDWYDQSFRAGINQDYNVSISGANENMNYYMSIGYLSNQGVAVGNDYSAIRSNLKVEGKVNDWLEIGANVNFQDRSDGDLAVDWQRQITVNSPYANYRNENGDLAVHPMGDLLAANYGYNYDFDRQYRDLEKGYTVFNSIFTAKVKLPFNITYSFNASPRYQFFYDRYFESTKHPDWVATTHGVNREQAKRFDWSLNNTINWEYTFMEKHRFNVTLVQEAEKRQYWMDRIEARNLLPSDALGIHETSTGDKDLSRFDSDDSKETADGMLARLFYSFNDRYMITTSVRRDGYSAFGTSNPRATFFSAAFAWTFSNEEFLKWKALSLGKLRLSWGQNGNRSLADPNVALANLSGSSTGATQGYLNTNGEYTNYYYLSVSRLANSRLQWEKTTAFNAGLDLGFLDNRINGTIDYFVMPTTDMIMNQTLPGFSGFSSITSNLGEVENRGFEISINTQNIKKRNFEWNTTLGFSTYKNTIKHLYYVYEDVIDASGNVISTKEKDDVANNWFIGHPISSIWDYNVNGIWQKNEVDEAIKYGQRPGDPKVANNFTADDTQNANGTTTPVYNDKDKEFLGQTAPPIHWSLRNNFTIYKNLNASINIYSYWGHKSLNTAYLNQDNPYSQITYDYNLYQKEYWTPENPSGEFARINARGPSGLTAPQKLFDRSFIRLENITIGYSIPRRYTAHLGIEKFKFNASVRNVAVWKKDKNWKYWDIETGSLAPRIYTIGFSLTY